VVHYFDSYFVLFVEKLTVWKGTICWEKFERDSRYDLFWTASICISYFLLKTDRKREQYDAKNLKAHYILFSTVPNCISYFVFENLTIKWTVCWEKFKGTVHMLMTENNCSRELISCSARFWFVFVLLNKWQFKRDSRLRKF
jgi:hypothetical protein